MRPLAIYAAALALVKPPFRSLPSPPVPILLRLLFYACLGVAAEVVFTAVCARFGVVLTADLDDPEAWTGWRLKGHSFVWMLPIYGCGFLLFEVVHDALRADPWLLRGLVYVAMLYALELTASVVLVRLTGANVWRWVGRGSVGGHIHLAMAPMWLVGALALERLHDALVRPLAG
jgi:hypothetical protein